MSDVILKPNKRRSRYSLEISDNAELIVKTPINPSHKVIDQLISENQDWIEKATASSQKVDSKIIGLE